MGSTRRNLVIAMLVFFSILLAPPATLFGLCAYAFYNNPFNDRQFDQGAWLANGAGKGNQSPRGPMAEDLCKRYLGVGTPKADVRKVLGTPDNSKYDDAEHVDRYFLGCWSFMSIDGDNLIIHYDKANRIIRTEIFTH